MLNGEGTEKMMIETGAPKANRGHGLIAVTMAMLGLLLLSGWPVRADQAERRIIPVDIDKGETYVITGFRGAPKIKVVENSNALAVQTNAPNKIVLVGSDTGQWKFDLTLASGEKVTYVISVKAAGPPQGSLHPGSAPTVIP